MVLLQQLLSHELCLDSCVKKNVLEIKKHHGIVMLISSYNDISCFCDCYRRFSDNVQFICRILRSLRYILDLLSSENLIGSYSVVHRPK